RSNIQELPRSCDAPWPAWSGSPTPFTWCCIPPPIRVPRGELQSSGPRSPTTTTGTSKSCRFQKNEPGPTASRKSTFLPSARSIPQPGFGKLKRCFCDKDRKKDSSMEDKVMWGKDEKVTPPVREAPYAPPPVTHTATTPERFPEPVRESP